MFFVGGNIGVTQIKKLLHTWDTEMIPVECILQNRLNASNITVNVMEFSTDSNFYFLFFSLFLGTIA